MNSIAPRSLSIHEATVGDLDSYAASVGMTTSASKVDSILETRQELPGILVEQPGRSPVLVSRTVFKDQLSRPFGRELFLRNPISQLIESLPDDALLLPSDTAIPDAVQAAMKRSSDLVYEPIILGFPGGEHRLLDLHVLLIAQSEMMSVAAETIRKQKDEAESANHAKSRFLANMSHEIRTPLTAILGFAESLCDESLSDKERQTASDVILRNGEHLLEVINDILDLSRIEADKLTIEHLEFSPIQLARDAVSLLSVRSDQKGLPLRLIFDSPIPESIQSDPTRLRQIILNLLGNAIKFTDGGYVEMRVSCDRQNETITFAVLDTGIGIAPEQLARLFEPFTQEDETTVRRFGGTGLGLTISLKLAQMLGGEVTAHTKSGEGSEFRLTVPTGSLNGVTLTRDPQKQVTQPAISAPIPAVSGRLLLAEDSPDNQLLIGTILRRLGAAVTIVDNGLVAVDATWRAFKTGEAFDVVLMDMHMPLMDGVTATRTLREKGCETPIIALTANAMESDRQLCMDAGCDAFATKPIDRRSLVDLINSFLTPENNIVADRDTAAVDRPHPETNSLIEAEPHLSDTDQTCFCFQTALQRVAGDKGLLVEIVRLVCQHAPEWLSEMRAAIEKRDSSELKRLAHTLKNSADNLGATGVYQAAYRLEVSAASNDFENATTAIQTLTENTTQLITALESRFLVTEQ